MKPLLVILFLALGLLPVAAQNQAVTINSAGLVQNTQTITMPSSVINGVTLTASSGTNTVLSGAGTYLSLGSGVGAALANAVNTAGGLVTNGQYQESRIENVSAFAYQAVVASGTQTLLSVTGSAGNVEYIQVAISPAAGDQAALQSSTISIQTDSNAAQTCDTATFFLFAGMQGADSRNVAFASDNLTVSAFDGLAFTYCSGFRRICIPFSSSCTIKLINGSASHALTVWTQVAYRTGAMNPTSWGYSTNGNVFHMIEENSTATQFSQFTVLPTVTATGVIDSIALCINGTDSYPQWLESGPTIAVDGSSEVWGGKEDFFGVQYYGAFAPYLTLSESWGIPVNRYLTSTTVATSMYRFFAKDPRPFSSSAAITMFNGQSGHGTPGTINYTSLVIYRTSQ